MTTKREMGVAKGTMGIVPAEHAEKFLACFKKTPEKTQMGVAKGTMGVVPAEHTEKFLACFEKQEKGTHDGREFKTTHEIKLERKSKQEIYNFKL